MREIEAIINIIIGIFHVHMYMGLCGEIFEPRECISILKYVQKFILVSGALLINHFDNTIARLVLYPLLYINFSFSYYLGSKIKKVSISYCFYLLGIIPEFLFAVLLKVSSRDLINTIHTNMFQFVISRLIMNIMTFVVIKIVKGVLQKKQYGDIPNYTLKSLLVLPLATIGMMSSIFYTDIHMTNQNKEILTVGVLMMLLANVFVFRLFDRLTTLTEESRKFSLLQNKNELMIKNYEMADQINQQNRMILHDINKYIRTAVVLLQAGDYDEVISIFEKLDIKIHTSRTERICEHKMLNALLIEKYQNAKEKSISFQCKIEDNVDISFIDDVDIITIMANLLDNAIEAALHMTERFINVNLFAGTNLHFVVIKVSNNFHHPLTHIGSGFLSTKVNKKEHGIGLLAVTGGYHAASIGKCIKTAILSGKREIFVKKLRKK